jgi:hypothetical protein
MFIYLGRSQMFLRGRSITARHMTFHGTLLNWNARGGQHVQKPPALFQS